MDVTRDQITYYRLKRSGLIDPFDTPEQCCRDLVGMQAQIHSAGGLALWNRTTGMNFQDYERKLYNDRTLVKLWGQRGTLHVYDARDWPLVVGSRENKPTWWERSIVRKGGDVKGFHAIVDKVRVLAEKEGIVSRSMLKELDIQWDIGVDVDLLSSWGGVFAHLVCEGTLCHIRPKDGEGRFAHRMHWLPDLDWDPPSFRETNIDLARRYLHTFGPSSVREYAYWRGITMGMAKEGINALRNEVIEVECDEGHMLALESDMETLCRTPPKGSTWPVKLLYRFDPLVLGHKDKSWIIDLKHYDKVWISAGHINGTVLVGGRIQGTWNYKRKGKTLEIEVRPFRKFGQRLVKKVEREAKGIAVFFGMEMGAVTWMI